MNLYVTKISPFLGQRSYEITGRSARPPPPLVSDVVPKPLVSEGVKDWRKYASLIVEKIDVWHEDSLDHSLSEI